MPVGSTKTGKITKKAPTQPDYLKTDSTYQAQSAALAKARKDYISQQNIARTGYDTNYASDIKSWGINKKTALSDQENDYASRGMMNSGLYGDAMATTNTDWDTRRGTLDLARQQYLQGLNSQLTNFTTQQTLTDTQAKQEAAARKAAGYGI